MNYDYDAAADQVRPSLNVQLTCRARGKVQVHSLEGQDLGFRTEQTDEGLRVTLERVPVYAVVEIRHPE